MHPGVIESFIWTAQPHALSHNSSIDASTVSSCMDKVVKSHMYMHPKYLPPVGVEQQLESWLYAHQLSVLQGVVQ